MSKKDRYSFTLNDQQIYGGGVILFKKHDDITELLLIKNRGKYEDLGGRIDKQDKNIYETISREVKEESNGLLSTIYNRIYDTPFIYTRISKYVICLVQATDEESKLKGEDFGDRELHDNIERTAHWMTIDEFYEHAKNKELNFRLINKNIFDEINKLKIEKLEKPKNEPTTYLF
jgi:hypothetical protein